MSRLNMNDNSKATQTWGSVDWVRLAPAKKRWNFISLANVALLTYRSLVAAGIIITIIVMMNIDHKQLRIFDVLHHRDATRSNHSNDSEAHSVMPSDGRMRQEYAVYNPSCLIPNYPEFHKDVKPFIRKEEVNCTLKPQLTSVTRLGRNISYTLKFHKNHLSHYQATSVDDVVCCYNIIYTNNTNYTIEECVIFDENATLHSSADIVHVACKVNKTTLYENVHFLVPVKTAARHKMKLTDSANVTDEKPLSVMIVGLGAVSRMNLLRTMPETVKYVEKNGWYGFKGHHKIENSLDNLIGPVLTGRSGKQLKRTCNQFEEGLPVDNTCPWIWKQFSDKRYITAYGEDQREPDSFGKFVKQPTDYFLSPQISFAHNIKAAKSNGRHPLCIGPKRAADYILDFSTDFASRFVNYPTFSLFWVNSVGHENINYPATIDRKFVSYLDTLASSGALNRSMVVFMSDHGFRKWNFRQTHMGFVEDSLPFLFIWLPKWYRERYPNKAENLARNTRMLTSHFDLHLTLMDVLGVSAKAEGCPTCVTLFDPVPWIRGCADAGIADDCCTCSRYKEIPADSSVVKQMALLVAADMNRLTSKNSDSLRVGYKCSTVSVERIKLARRQTLKPPNSDSQVYLIQVDTKPDNGTHEAVINLYTLEVLSILSSYDNQQRKLDDSQSFCAKFPEGKPWCVCERI